MLVLSPLAVRPDRQRTGVGTALLVAAREQAVALGVPALFLEGDPTYYARRGYVPGAALGFSPDADLFVTVQAFDRDGREVKFPGTVDPHAPLAQGWLRASHRKLDPERTLPYRPYHTHDERQPLTPGAVYEVQVEIWPTGVVLPAGYRVAFQISGHDFEREPPDDPNEAWVSRGSGPWLHTHPADRPAELFAGRTTLHTGGEHPSQLLLPVIPAR